jgi:hypothetical protein
MASVMIHHRSLRYTWCRTLYAFGFQVRTMSETDTRGRLEHGLGADLEALIRLYILRSVRGLVAALTGLSHSRQ